jgi:hypothetical protein
MTIKRHFSPALLIFLLAGCAGLDAKRDSDQDGTAGDLIPLLREYAFPAGLEFRPEAFSLPAAAPGVGAITREQRDPLASRGEVEKGAVAESFREAYIEGLLRGLPLEGTLGGDLVHSWPPEEALCLAQNWRSRDTAPTSWGIPGLVLAIRGTEGDAAHIVRGGILDQYGRSGGRDRSNGAAGYGAPLGEEFLYGNGVAQWFEHGLIRVDAAGKGSFEEGPAPSLSGAGRRGGGSIEEQFQRALRRGLYANLPHPEADDALRSLELPATETMPAGTLYFQTFNRGGVLLLLPQVPGLPFRARIVAGAFLEAFLADGSEAGLEGRLLQGIERYGLPLTDACPAPEAGAYRDASARQQAQRFTRGWMTLL